MMVLKEKEDIVNKWIPHLVDNKNIYGYKCSNCNRWNLEPINICPNCKTKIRLPF